MVGEDGKRSREDFEVLAPRELEIALLWLEGMTSDRIADKVGIKSTSVRTTMYRVYRKLGVSDGREFSRLYALSIGDDPTPHIGSNAPDSVDVARSSGVASTAASIGVAVIVTALPLLGTRLTGINASSSAPCLVGLVLSLLIALVLHECRSRIPLDVLEDATIRARISFAGTLVIGVIGFISCIALVMLLSKDSSVYAQQLDAYWKKVFAYSGAWLMVGAVGWKLRSTRTFAADGCGLVTWCGSMLAVGICFRIGALLHLVAVAGFLLPVSGCFIKLPSLGARERNQKGNDNRSVSMKAPRVAGVSSLSYGLWLGLEMLDISGVLLGLAGIASLVLLLLSVVIPRDDSGLPARVSAAAAIIALSGAGALVGHISYAYGMGALFFVTFYPSNAAQDGRKSRWSISWAVGGFSSGLLLSVVCDLAIRWCRDAAVVQLDRLPHIYAAGFLVTSVALGLIVIGSMCLFCSSCAHARIIPATPGIDKAALDGWRRRAEAALVLKGFSEHEVEILVHTVLGETASEIGERLGYSSGTVKAVRLKGYAAFHVHDKTSFSKAMAQVEVL